MLDQRICGGIEEKALEYGDWWKDLTQYVRGLKRRSETARHPRIQLLKNLVRINHRPRAGGRPKKSVLSGLEAQLEDGEIVAPIEDSSGARGSAEQSSNIVAEDDPYVDAEPDCKDILNMISDDEAEDGGNGNGGIDLLKPTSDPQSISSKVETMVDGLSGDVGKDALDTVKDLEDAEDETSSEQKEASTVIRMKSHNCPIHNIFWLRLQKTKKTKKSCGLGSI